MARRQQELVVLLPVDCPPGRRGLDPAYLPPDVVKGVRMLGAQPCPPVRQVAAQERSRREGVEGWFLPSGRAPAIEPLDDRRRDVEAKPSGLVERVGGALAGCPGVEHGDREPGRHTPEQRFHRVEPLRPRTHDRYPHGATLARADKG